MSDSSTPYKYNSKFDFNNDGKTDTTEHTLELEILSGEYDDEWPESAQGDSNENSNHLRANS